MNLPVDTLSDEIEPYLLREQLIVRTPRGRLATARAYQHLGKPYRPRADGPKQKGLFDETENRE
jgi:Holliday junction DNA helicase RuvB